MDVEGDDASGSQIKERDMVLGSTLRALPVLEFELSEPNSTVTGKGAMTGDGMESGEGWRPPI